MDSKRPVVTVFGSAATEPGEPLYGIARQLGEAIAASNWTLCNGGYGGTMEAAARGAVQRGGHTIGVTCCIFKGRAGPNPYIRQEITSADLFERLGTLIRLGDAYVVLPGGTGTLLELAAVWELLNKQLIEGPRGIVLLGDWWNSVVAAVRGQQPGALPLHAAADVPTAIAQLREALDRRGAGA